MNKKIILGIGVGFGILFLAGFFVVLIKYPGLIPSDELSETQEFFLKRHGEPHIINPDFNIEVFINNLNFPTKITFVNETMLVSQKIDGQIFAIEQGIQNKNPILDLNVESFGERGLVGIESAYENDQFFILVYYTESNTNTDTYSNWISPNYKSNLGSKLVRYTWDDGRLINPEILFQPIIKSNSLHQGGALEFSNGIIFLGTGDNDEPSYITNDPRQEERSTTGAIYALDIHGNPYTKNPFIENADLKYFYALGIRNIYGLSTDPITGNLWDTENGPAEFDEVNLVFPGFNSGWNKIMGPLGKGNFSKPISTLTQIENSKYADPIFSWKQTVAPTAIEFLTSNNFNQNYKNDVFIGDVRGNLYHFDLNEKRDAFLFNNLTLEDNIADDFSELTDNLIAENLGLITDIKIGPDGNLYVVSLIFDNDEPGWKIHRDQITSGDKNLGSGKGIIFKISPVS